MTSGQENLSLEGRCQIFAPRGLLCALATTSLFKKAASPLSRRWDDAEIADLAECSGPRDIPGSRANSRSCSTAWTQGGLNCPGGYRRGSPCTDGQFQATRAQVGRSSGRRTRDTRL